MLEPLCIPKACLWGSLLIFDALQWLRSVLRHCRGLPCPATSGIAHQIAAVRSPWILMWPFVIGHRPRFACMHLSYLRHCLTIARGRHVVTYRVSASLRTCCTCYVLQPLTLSTGLPYRSKAEANQQCVDLGTCRVCSCGVTPRALCRMAIWIVKSVCRVLGRGFLGGVRRVFVLEPLCIPKACLWGSLLIFDALQWLRSVLRHYRDHPCPATSGIAHQIAAVRSPWILMWPFVIGHRPRFACMHLSYLCHCPTIARGRHVVTYRVSASLRTCCTCCVLQPLTLSTGLPYRSKAEASFLYRSAQDFVVRCLCLCYCLKAALRRTAFHAQVHACQPFMQFFMQFFDFFSIDTTQYFRYACRFMFHDAADSRVALTVYFANTEHQSRGLLHCPMQLKPDVVERRFHNWRSWAVRTPNARPFIIPLPHPLLPPVIILRHTSLTQLVCPGRRQADANILVGAGLSSCACCTSNFCAVELRVLRRLHQRINPLANVPFAGHVHVQSASAGPCTEVGF